MDGETEYFCFYIMMKNKLLEPDTIMRKVYGKKEQKCLKRILSGEKL